MPQGLSENTPDIEVYCYITGIVFLLVSREWQRYSFTDFQTSTTPEQQYLEALLPRSGTYLNLNRATS